MARLGAWFLVLGAWLPWTFLHPTPPRGLRRPRTARAAEKDAVDAVLRTVGGMDNDELERLVEVKGVEFIHGRDGSL